jgi:hypothetical protein
LSSQQAAPTVRAAGDVPGSVTLPSVVLEVRPWIDEEIEADRLAGHVVRLDSDAYVSAVVARLIAQASSVGGSRPV